MVVRNLKLASMSEQKHLIDKASANKKYHLIVLLMLDGGLRVSEVVRLKYKNFDFGGQYVSVLSLKKKSDYPIYRTVPLSYRLYEALSVYVDGKVLKDDNFVFPGEIGNDHISREGVTRWIKRNSSYAVTSHMLRHTFATKVVRSSGIEEAQKLLGHQSRDTTEHYSHIPFADLKSSIDLLDNPSFKERLRRKFFKPKRISKVSEVVSLKGIIGRKKEALKLSEAFEKRINLYLVGEQGVGKSKLLSQLSDDRILQIDDMKMINATLKNLLTHLSEARGKKLVIENMNGIVLSDNVISKASQKRCLDFIIGCVDYKEFTIVIDDLTNLTKSGVIVLERLKEKFHLIVAARRIKIEHSTFLSNFEKLSIEPLSRDSSTSLIYAISKNLRSRIEDYEAYKNYVYGQSLGNPMKIVELVERLSKEQFIGYAELESISHVNSKRAVDFSLPIILMICSLVVLRYIRPDISSDASAYRLIGGASMIFALFARTLFQFTKRKFV